jgi:hypothetical protein
MSPYDIHEAEITCYFACFVLLAAERQMLNRDTLDPFCEIRTAA